MVNSIYQSINIKKEYRINLTLKHNIDFDFIDSKEFFKTDITEEKYDDIAYARDFLERYERILQIKMQEKIYYEKAYNKNLIEISEHCKKLKMKIEGKYYFVNCITSNPNESEKKIVDNLSNILTKLLENMELQLTKETLNNLGLKQKELGLKKFEVIQKKLVIHIIF